ncbi:hypothetical protein DMC30DRAFT_269011 [Rhodotorula diobovata]|uniref:Uncharacterized protein n=1 Tax=Rhodotorula diobovata TaxID=5288 RepID=A0A5C5FV25_9BASI|nr:hypothetical protein DMC30DRAFT_269011 [Rhodotorula diobovata]
MKFAAVAIAAAAIASVTAAPVAVEQRGLEERWGKSSVFSEGTDSNQAAKRDLEERWARGALGQVVGLLGGHRLEPVGVKWPRSYAASSCWAEPAPFPLDALSFFVS